MKKYIKENEIQGIQLMTPTQPIERLPTCQTKQLREYMASVVEIPRKKSRWRRAFDTVCHVIVNTCKVITAVAVAAVAVAKAVVYFGAKAAAGAAACAANLGLTYAKAQAIENRPVRLVRPLTNSKS
jgi:hypothetical protein